MKVLKNLCVIMFLVAFSGTVFAQSEINKSDRDAQSDAIAALSLAADLVDYGTANNDAYSLISAAKIVMANPTQSAPPNRVNADEGTTDAPETARGDKSAGATDLDASSILAEAKKYAEGDDELLSIISSMEEEVKSRGARGYEYGTVNGTWKIPAYGTRTFRWTFTGKELAEILFNGDNDTDLDYYVYDTSGNLLGYDTDATDYAYFSWYPPYTKQYVFKVVNRGSVYNMCRIISN